MTLVCGYICYLKEKKRSAVLVQLIRQVEPSFCEIELNNVFS